MCSTATNKESTAFLAAALGWRTWSKFSYFSERQTRQTSTCTWLELVLASFG